MAPTVGFGTHQAVVAPGFSPACADLKVGAAGPDIVESYEMSR